jgi:hypothetical protein
VCGVWCVVCGVWCVVCGVWCVVCGVWCVVCGVWCVVSGVWFLTRHGGALERRRRRWGGETLCVRPLRHLSKRCFVLPLFLPPSLICLRSWPFFFLTLSSHTGSVPGFVVHSGDTSLERRLLRVLERAGPGSSPVSPLAVLGLRPCLVCSIWLMRDIWFLCRILFLCDIIFFFCLVFESCQISLRAATLWGQTWPKLAFYSSIE